MSSGKLPEYTLLTPLQLTPDVVAHDLEALASLGLLPHDLQPHHPYPFLPLPPASPPPAPSPDPDDPDYEEEGPARRGRGSEDRQAPGEEDSDSSGGGRDPFSPACKIPLPTPFSPYEYWLEPSFIRRRNERERQRVRNVNDGFERLKARLPIVGKERDKRLSKVEILRMAIRYIQSLQELLGQSEAKENLRCPPDAE